MVLFLDFVDAIDLIQFPQVSLNNNVSLSVEDLDNFEGLVLKVIL